MKAADRLGWSESELSQYLRGHKSIGPRKAREIERKLNLPLHTLDTELHGLSPDVVSLAHDIESLSKDDREQIRAIVKRLKK